MYEKRFCKRVGTIQEKDTLPQGVTEHGCMASIARALSTNQCQPGHPGQGKREQPVSNLGCWRDCHKFYFTLPQLLPKGPEDLYSPPTRRGEGSWYPGLGWGPPKDTQLEKCGKGLPNLGQAPPQLETSIWPEAALVGDPGPRPGPTLGKQSSSRGPI